MYKQDVSSIVVDLDRWAIGHFGPKLTWEMLENRFGFSRQSLQAKPEIKAAYDSAKRTLAGEFIGRPAKTRHNNEELMLEIERLKLEITNYQRLEVKWQERWQRIAFHIRQRGFQISNFDTTIPQDAALLSGKEASKILNEFDKEIPPSGRI